MDDQIIVSVASIPSRCVGLIRVIETLSPQCTQMMVYLNGYRLPDQLPVLPRRENVHYHISLVNEGPRGKFLFADRMPGYRIVCDDDLFYPHDYVYTMIQHITKLQRKAIVGLHGKLLLYRKPPEPMTYKFYRYNDTVTDYCPVHMLGTGVMAYHTSAFNVGFNCLEKGKIDDQVAIMAQDQQVPMVVVPHDKDWVKMDPVLSETDALHQDMFLKRETSNRIHDHGSWKLYTTDTNEIPNYF